MRKCKRLLACAAAFAMSCTMVTGWANTATIESVEIVIGETRTPVAENGKIAPSDYVEVTVKVMNEADPAVAVAAAQATFLSYLKEVDTVGSEKVLDNTTIQYVDQGTTGEDGKVVFGFRPRFTTGDYIAKAGGDDVAAPDSFIYSVEKPKTQLTLEAKDATVTVGEVADVATFTMGGIDGATIVVKVDGTALAEGQYSISGTTLTINNSVFTEAKEYSVIITAEGDFIESAVAKVVASAKQVVVPDEDVPEVEDKVEALAPVVSGGTATLTPSITTNGGVEVPVTYAPATEDADKVTITDGKVELKDGLFAAKVTINATVEGTEIGSQKTIYLIPDNAVISFGNLALIADADGNCAFADDTEFEIARKANETAITETKVEAINYAIGRRGEDAEKHPHFEETLDFKRDGGVSLAEYRILKLMLDGDADYAPSKVNTHRNEKYPKASN